MSPESEALPGRAASSPPGDAAEEIKEDGRRIAEIAKESATQAAREQQNVAADFLKDISSAFRKGADELRDRGRGDTASLVGWTADEVGHLGRELTNRSPDELIGEIRDFAHRQPALVAGAAFLVGFGVLRFLKSSASDGGYASSNTPQAGR